MDGLAVDSFDDRPRSLPPASFAAGFSTIPLRTEVQEKACYDRQRRDEFRAENALRTR